MGVKIITDSASDITQVQAEEMGIEIIPMTTIFGSTEYLDGVTLTSRDFLRNSLKQMNFHTQAK